jgi:hypothetical protein
MDDQDVQRELDRINERIVVISNWIMQGRGDPDSLWWEMRYLQAKRKVLTDRTERQADNG